MSAKTKKVSDDRIEKWQVRISRAFSFALCGAFYAGLVYLAIDWFGHYIVEAINHFTRP